MTEEKKEVKRANTYTAEEAAEILGVRVETVRQWCHDKRIPSYKAGSWRIPVQIVDDIATGRQILPPPPEERRQRQRTYRANSKPGGRKKKKDGNGAADL